MLLFADNSVWSICQPYVYRRFNVSNPDKKPANNGNVVMQAYVSAEMKAEFHKKRVAEGFQSEAEAMRYLIRYFTMCGLPTHPAIAG